MISSCAGPSRCSSGRTGTPRPQGTPPRPAPGGLGTAAGAAPGAGLPARPAAWRSLPPIQRSVGAAPLTAPAVPFGRALAGTRPPDPILRPLAHAVAADGPAGLVSGIATPLVVPAGAVVTSTGHGVLPAPHGVQRRARTVSDARQPARVLEGTAAEAPPPGRAEGGSADPPAPPPRVLPIVAPSGATPALTATRVAAATAPEAARAVAPVSGAASSTIAAAPAVAGSPVKRSASSPTQLPATPPGAGAVGPEASPGAAASAPGAEAMAAPPTQHRSLGASRRLGLGAPLASRPSVQRDPDGPDLPLARAGRRAAPPASPVTASLPPAPRRAAATQTALPVLRVAAESGAPATVPEPRALRSEDVPAVPGPAIDGDAQVDSDLAGPVDPPVQRSVERPLVGDAGRRAAALSCGRRRCRDASRRARRGADAQRGIAARQRARERRPADRAGSTPRKRPGRECRHESAPGSPPGRRGCAGFDRPRGALRRSRRAAAALGPARRPALDAGPAHRPAHAVRAARRGALAARRRVAPTGSQRAGRSGGVRTGARPGRPAPSSGPGSAFGAPTTPPAPGSPADRGRPAAWPVARPAAGPPEA